MFVDRWSSSSSFFFFFLFFFLWIIIISSYHHSHHHENAHMHIHRASANHNWWIRIENSIQMTIRSSYDIHSWKIAVAVFFIISIACHDVLKRYSTATWVRLTSRTSILFLQLILCIFMIPDLFNTCVDTKLPQSYLSIDHWKNWYTFCTITTRYFRMTLPSTFFMDLKSTVFTWYRILRNTSWQKREIIYTNTGLGDITREFYNLHMKNISFWRSDLVNYDYVSCFKLIPFYASKIGLKTVNI